MTANSVEVPVANFGTAMNFGHRVKSTMPTKIKWALKALAMNMVNNHPDFAIRLCDGPKLGDIQIYSPRVHKSN